MKSKDTAVRHRPGARGLPRRQNTQSLIATTRRTIKSNPAAFTLLELLAIMGLLLFFAAVLASGLAQTQGLSKAVQCQNNLRQLTTCWREWTDAHNDMLLHSDFPGSSSRPIWMTGYLDFDGANPSNWDTNQDLARSPLWPYLAGNAAVFRCPADSSTVARAPDGATLNRIRSYSMNGALGSGNWLEGYVNPHQTTWRTYAKGAEIVLPARTFVLVGEHPGSMNDGNLNVTCTGAEFSDPTNSAKIIDFPSSSHGGAGNFSFADGRVECHRWLGARMRTPFHQGVLIFLNVPADDSWMDVRWLAQNTTIRR